MKNKRGFVSLEVVLFTSAIIGLLAVIIGLFSFVNPTFAMQRDVDVLARQAQMNGGLTQQDVSNFEARMNKYPFVRNSNLGIDITAKTTSGYNVGAGGSYVTRGSGEVINIEIKVPCDSRMLKKVANASTDYYLFNIAVVSEKIE